MQMHLLLFTPRSIPISATTCSSSEASVPIFCFRRMDSGGRRSHRLVTNAPRPQDPHPNLSSPQQGKKAIAVDLSEYANEFPPLSSGVSSSKGKSQDIIRSQLGHNRSNRSEHPVDMNKSGHSQTHSSFAASFSMQSGITDKNYMIGSDEAKTFTSNELHMAERRPHTPNRSPQCGSDILDENRYTRHYQGSSQDPSKPHHTESHGINSDCRCSFCPKSASSNQVQDHRDEISRARKEEDHKSNGTGASSMQNNLQHQQKGSDINISDINDFPVLSGGSSGKGKSHHIGSSKPQISTSHDTKIGHDRSSQVAQYFSESVAKQENSPKYGASDSTLGSGGPTNARHLPNNSNNLQNLNQGASDQSNPQASFSTWSGSGDEFTNSRTPQPGGYSPERADTEFDHEKSQQVAQRFSPSMAKQENSPKFGAEDSSFSFGRPTNARHLPNISMSSNSPQNLNQVASHHSSLEASYSTWSGSGDKISKSRTPQPGRTSPKRAECADDKPIVPPFDIRPVKTGPFQLNPSLHTKNMEKREHEKKRNNNQILRSGMVLLKNYLTEAEQVKIVRECRELGLKPGGFYQPGYKNGAKLHLHMMCLGKEWDPETRLYQEQRSVDGAKPPLIPNVFSELVSKAIKSSHSLIKENHKSSNPERELPCMEPDLCIVNFYSRTGKLGLHQDRDESSESLKNGLPVVSFSLGETAVFLYGDERDADKANEVQLESGDVLIFGGKSRHVFHGVPSIIANSAPGFLANHLRPGRLNLTFRKY